MRNARLVSLKEFKQLYVCNMFFNQIRINVRINCVDLQRTMEAFMIILCATQLLYIVAIHGAASVRRI